ncbi:MAG TPA: hypothetical protein VJC16_04700 [Candidatus Nanoarchaeia archaeon]|nr:hypothetical protein [Candidatus Nanoarchaeia archaeon]
MPTPNYAKTASHLEVVGRFSVKHKDFFNMKELYNLLHEWLVQNEYASRADRDFGEVLMLERIRQESGKEVWCYWRNSKNPAGSSFYRFVLELNYHIILLKSTEVIHEGVKYSTNWGEVELNFVSKLVIDPEGKWQKNWFTKSVFPLFFRRIYKKNWEMHRKELYREAYRWQQAAKEYLKLRVFAPEPEERFWPELGLGQK